MIAQADKMSIIKLFYVVCNKKKPPALSFLSRSGRRFINELNCHLTGPNDLVCGFLALAQPLRSEG